MQTLVKTLTWMILLGCSAGVQTPRGHDSDGGVTIVDGNTGVELVAPESADVVEEGTETTEEITEETTEEATEEAEVVEITVAQRFVEAGGQALCLGMFYGLSPEWDPAVCDAYTEGQERCFRQRQALSKIAENICAAIIEEGLALKLDPGMALADAEQESNWGRVNFDRASRTYRVNWDVCEMDMARTRLIDPPETFTVGEKVRLTWTFAETRRNTQNVRILAVSEGNLRINTCAAGEAGSFQNLPVNYAGRRGQAVGLQGNSAERREQFLEDPVAQVRLGMRELARHRDMVPTAIPERFETWIFAYNTGRPEMGEHGRDYALKILRHYSRACHTGYVRDDTRRPIANAWSECARVDAAIDELDTSEE